MTSRLSWSLEMRCRAHRGTWTRSPVAQHQPAAADDDGRHPGHHDPALGTTRVGLQGQPAPRLDHEPLDLPPGTLVEDRPAAPWTVLVAPGCRGGLRRRGETNGGRSASHLGASPCGWATMLRAATCLSPEQDPGQPLGNRISTTVGSRGEPTSTEPPTLEAIRRDSASPRPAPPAVGSPRPARKMSSRSSARIPGRRRRRAPPPAVRYDGPRSGPRWRRTGARCPAPGRSPARPGRHSWRPAGPGACRGRPPPGRSASASPPGP